MKNTLADLNNHLFDTLERLIDEDMSDEQMEKEITRSKAVTAVASTIIQNGELTLRAVKHLNEYGIETANESLPLMMGVGK